MALPNIASTSYNNVIMGVKGLSSLSHRYHIDPVETQYHYIRECMVKMGDLFDMSFHDFVRISFKYPPYNHLHNENGTIKAKFFFHKILAKHGLTTKKTNYELLLDFFTSTDKCIDFSTSPYRNCFDLYRQVKILIHDDNKPKLFNEIMF